MGWDRIVRGRRSYINGHEERSKMCLGHWKAAWLCVKARLPSKTFLLNIISFRFFSKIILILNKSCMNRTKNF